MSLSAIYTELHRRAAQTGEDRSHTFKGGARIAVRVRDGQTTLTISRQKKRVGDTELTTFRRDCNVPVDALRYPSEDQRQRTDADGVGWYFVTFRWIEES